MSDVAVANIEETTTGLRDEWEPEDFTTLFWDLDRGDGCADQLCDIINNYLVLEYPDDLDPIVVAYRVSWDAVIITLRDKQGSISGDKFFGLAQVASYSMDARGDVVSKDATLEEAFVQIAEFVTTLLPAYRVAVGREQ